MKVKNDHRSIFSNLSNWKEVASTGVEPLSGPDLFFRLLLSNCFTFIYSRSSYMNYFVYTSHQHHISSFLTGRYELNKLTSRPICGFVAQLVEHRTGIAEVTGSNPVEALNFFRLLLSNCLNWKIYCDNHSSLSMIRVF